MAIRKICVLGTGTMGSGIAQVAATAGFETALFDVSKDQLQKALDGIRGRLDRSVAKGRLTEAEADLAQGRLRISHDLGVVARIAQRVLVMYAGFVVEDAPVYELFANPRHPYTIGLLGSLPRLDLDGDAELISIPGQPPDMTRQIVGCPFAPRCTFAVARCQDENPGLEAVGADHRVACWEATRTADAWHTTLAQRSG